MDKVADGLRDYGAILVKDPRVTKEDSDRFLVCCLLFFLKKEKDIRNSNAHSNHSFRSKDMMEDYYAQSDEVGKLCYKFFIAPNNKHYR